MSSTVLRRNRSQLVLAAALAAMLAGAGGAVADDGAPGASAGAATRAAWLVPTTGPATRPVDPQVADLIRELAKPDWRSRQKAVPELVKAGEFAVAPLDELARTSGNVDVRTSAQEVLRQIIDNRLTGPSFVTLHLKNATPRQAYEELARQCHFQLQPWPDDLWTIKGPEKADITIDLDHQPYWIAAQELSSFSGLHLAEHEGRVRLMRSMSAECLQFPPERAAAKAMKRVVATLPPHSTVAGPFLITASEIAADKPDANVGDAQAKDAEILMLRLVAESEPKVRLLSVGDLKVEECLDDKGNSLLGTKSPRGFSSNGLGCRFGVPIKRPAVPGSKIARFKGSATFSLQMKSRDLEIADILNARESVHHFGPHQFTVKGVTKKDDGYEVHIVQSAGLFESLHDMVDTRLRLMDAAGQALDHGSFGGSVSGDVAEMRVRYFNSKRADGRVSGVPAKLTLEVPTEVREVTVSFELTDLPQPK